MFVQRLFSPYINDYDLHTQLFLFYCEWGMFAMSCLFYFRIVWKLKSKLKQQDADILLIRAFTLLVILWFIFELPRLLVKLGHQKDWFLTADCYQGTYMLCQEEICRLRFRYRNLIYHATETFGRLFNFFNSIILIIVFKKFRIVFKQGMNACFAAVCVRKPETL